MMIRFGEPLSIKRLIFFPPSAATSAMRELRKIRFSTVLSAVAICGALLNAWVLTGHLTATALAELHAFGGGIPICRQSGIAYVPNDAGKTGKPAPGKGCPICTGLAALHLAVIDEPVQLAVRRAVPTSTTTEANLSVVSGHRLHAVLNRGPPRTA